MSVWERELLSLPHECCTRASYWEQPNKVTKGGPRHQGRDKITLKSLPVSLFTRDGDTVFILSSLLGNDSATVQR